MLALAVPTATIDAQRGQGSPPQPQGWAVRASLSNPSARLYNTAKQKLLDGKQIFTYTISRLDVKLYCEVAQCFDDRVHPTMRRASGCDCSNPMMRGFGSEERRHRLDLVRRSTPSIRRPKLRDRAGTPTQGRPAFDRRRKGREPPLAARFSNATTSRMKPAILGERQTECVHRPV